MDVFGEVQEMFGKGASAVKGAVAFVVSSGLTCILFRHEMAAFANRIRKRFVR